jgi:Mrp family chromosome partitioning ATPase
MIASIFGIAPPPHAIEDAFAKNGEGRFLVQAAEHANLRLLLSRPEGATMVDAITPELVRTMIDNLSAWAEIVIFDTAPVGEAAETMAFAEAADAVVLSVRLGSTRSDRLLDALRLFAQRGVPLAGVVLTSDRGAETSPYDYGYAGPPQPQLRPERSSLARRGKFDPVPPPTRFGVQREPGAQEGGRRSSIGHNRP